MGVDEKGIPDTHLKGAQGKYSGTYDPYKLIETTREFIGSHDRLLLLTNFEISPHENWRYFLWENYNNASVVSVASMDPMYWRMEDPHRLPTLKHRARVACLNAVGRQIGLNSCENYRCFLFDPVKSVTDLDDMILLGPEHDLVGLTNKRFSTNLEKPEKMDSLVKMSG